MKQRALGNGTLVPVRRARGTTVWVCDYRDAAGLRRRESLGTDRVVAQRRHAELIKQRDLELSGIARPDTQHRLLAELRDLYLRDLAHRSTVAHLANVTSRLNRVLKALPARRVKDLKPHDVLRMRADVLGRGCGNTNANLYVGSLSAMLSWAATAGLIAENPIRNLKRLPENESTKRHKRRALSEDEIARFLAATEADDAHWARWQPDRCPQVALFRAFLETGCRYGELTTTTWSDVDLDRALLTVRAENAKSRKQRTIPLRAEMVEILRTLPRGERVFLTPDGSPWCRATNNVSRILRRVLKRAGISRADANGRKIDIHALRGTCATRLARAGVGLAVTQRILGHSSPRLTAQHYMHLDMGDLRSAVDRIAPSHTHVA